MMNKLFPLVKKVFCLGCVLMCSGYVLAIDFENKWTPLYKGIDYRLLVKNDVLKIHQIRIDSHDPNIEVFVTKPLPNSTNTEALKTSTFLTREKAQVVINGSGYSPSTLSPEGVLKQCRSLAIYDGVLYAKSERENAAFVVLKNGKKKIIKANELRHYKNDISMAIGAWDYGGAQGLLLEHGESCLPKPMPPHEIKARSAIGISKDGETLFLVVVEGRPRQRSIFKQLVSPSTSMQDLVSIMKDLGCDRAMTLDAGGSSSMVVENIINGKPLVLNIPSDHKGERAVGSHIGIRASYLEDKNQLKIFRALQENTAFFDLLQKSESALNEIYMNEDELARLDEGDIIPLDKLYERFGVGRYIDSILDYSKIWETKRKSFDECFLKNGEYGFYCGSPNEFFKEFNLKTTEYKMKFSDLTFVQENQGAIKTGSTKANVYMDENKIYYFVQSPKSVKNELIGSKLMELILGARRTAIVKLLEDKPEKIAARMIKGFRIKNKYNLHDKKIVGSAELDLTMDFLGLIDRHFTENIGIVEIDSQTFTPARIDYSYSFQFEKRGSSSPKSIDEGHDPLSLKQLYHTLEKYPLRQIIPALEKIIDVPDEQIFIEIVRCWTVLSKLNIESFSLIDATRLASKLIQRKTLFKRVCTELKDNQSSHAIANTSKLKDKVNKWKDKIKDNSKKINRSSIKKATKK